VNFYECLKQMLPNLWLREFIVPKCGWWFAMFQAASPLRILEVNYASGGGMENCN
jgi:hypothetical protein